MNQLIFLTGCVNPNGMILTALQDPKQRLEQYINTVNYYLAETDRQILFVENSNTDISMYFEKAIDSKRLEILTFKGNDYNKKLGKGYGEILIIDFALKNSQLVKSSDFLIKITGRIRVLNIKKVLKQFDHINTESVFVNFQRTLTYADSKCWAASKSFYLNYLLKYKETVNDSLNFHFEHALCKATHQAIIDNFYFRFINHLPRYSGIGGTENRKYKDGFLHWFPLSLKHKLRLNALRK